MKNISLIIIFCTLVAFPINGIALEAPLRPDYEKKIIIYRPNIENLRGLIQAPSQFDYRTVYKDMAIIPVLDVYTSKITHYGILRYKEMNLIDTIYPITDKTNFLFDNEAQQKYFLNKNINVEESEIFSAPYWLGGGIIIHVKSHGDSYFMPVLDQEKHGVFENKRIYTAEEFAQISKPHECKLIIRGVTVDCTRKPTMEFGDVLIPLRPLLENLGFSVQWDSETGEIVFSNDTDIYSIQAENYDGYRKILKNGVYYEEEGFIMDDGITLVGEGFLATIQAICNVNAICNNDTFTITISDKSNDE